MVSGEHSVSAFRSGFGQADAPWVFLDHVGNVGRFQSEVRFDHEDKLRRVLQHGSGRFESVHMPHHKGPHVFVTCQFLVSITLETHGKDL